MGTRLLNDHCPGFKRCADGAWYPIRKWRQYPLDLDDLDMFSEWNFDYKEVRDNAAPE